MTSLSIYVDNRAEHIFIDGVKSNIYLNTNSISDRHCMEPTNRDARMTICRWSRKNNDGDVAMHAWSYSPDTRREQTDNVEENDMQMDDKRKGTGRSTEGKPLKMTRMTPQKAKQMKHRTEISTFLGFSNIWRNKGERSPFRILQSRRGTSCYRDGPQSSTGRPSSTTDFAYTETYKGHRRTVTWHQDPTDA